MHIQVMLKMLVYQVETAIFVIIRGGNPMPEVTGYLDDVDVDGDTIQVEAHIFLHLRNMYFCTSEIYIFAPRKYIFLHLGYIYFSIPEIDIFTSQKYIFLHLRKYISALFRMRRMERGLWRMSTLLYQAGDKKANMLWFLLLSPKKFADKVFACTARFGQFS